MVWFNSLRRSLSFEPKLWVSLCDTPRVYTVVYSAYLFSCLEVEAYSAEDSGTLDPHRRDV